MVHGVTGLTNLAVPWAAQCRRYCQNLQARCGGRHRPGRVRTIDRWHTSTRSPAARSVPELPDERILKHRARVRGALRHQTVDCHASQVKSNCQANILAALRAPAPRCVGRAVAPHLRRRRARLPRSRPGGPASRPRRRPRSSRGGTARNRAVARGPLPRTPMPIYRFVAPQRGRLRAATCHHRAERAARRAARPTRQDSQGVTTAEPCSAGTRRAAR